MLTKVFAVPTRSNRELPRLLHTHLWTLDSSFLWMHLGKVWDAADASLHFLFGHVAVLPLLLRGKENSVHLCAPLLLREMSAGRRRGMKHRTASFFLFSFIVVHSLSGLLSRWTNLAAKLTEQAEYDCAWVVDMDWTYEEIDKQLQKLSQVFRIKS